MSYTETTTTSYGSRLSKSFGGVVVGLVLFVAGTVLLWWNEGDFVATRDALNEAQAITVEMPNITTVDAAMNGKLIHASGRADTKDVLTDGIFGVQDTAIALKRTVEYYQWTESSKSEKRQKLGGGEETVTTYTYSKKWVDAPVATSSFHDPEAPSKYANIQLTQVDDQTQYAPNVSFGAYRLPEFFVHSIGGDTPLQVKLSGDVVKQIETQIYSQYPQLRGGGNLAAAVASYAGTQASAQSSGSGLVHTQSNSVYIGKSPAAPTIGDVRVSFTVVRPADVSIIARVNGDTFEKYRASNGKNISELSMGKQSMEAMFGDAHESNAIMTWLLRAVGIILVVAGLKMVLAPLAVLVSVLPFLGSLMDAGAGIVAGLVGLSWSLIIIAIAWLRFRPLIGGSLLAVAVVLFALCFFIKKKGQAPAPAAGPTNPAA